MNDRRHASPSSANARFIVGELFAEYIYICDAEVCERARARALCWMKEAG